jgi:lantibiotic modifying enzyme
MCGSDLYGGTSGIGIFLAHLYAATGEKIFRSTAEGAIRQALSQLDSFPRGKRIGFYTGLTGIAYALLQLAHICSLEKFIALALLILEDLGKDDLQTEIEDIAGAVPLLLKFHHEVPRDFLLKMVVEYGEHLVSSAKKSEVGWSWDTRSGEDWEGVVARDAHGIGLALLEIYRATGEVKFRHAAEQGFHYERHRSKTCAANHERATAKDPSIREAGASILAKLRVFEILRDKVYLDEAVVALRRIEVSPLSSLSESDSEDFSAAQGLAGIGDVFIEASRIVQEKDYQRIAETIGMWGIDRCRDNNGQWPCKPLGGLETPGLMPGLAGIGYFYLRLHESEKVPSLLLVIP